MSALLDKLSLLWRREDGYALYREVRSCTGRSDNGVGIADVIIANTWPSRGWSIILGEEKASRADFLREIRQSAKMQAVGRFCSKFFFVVPAPWKKIVLTLDELPEGCGLISIGTGDPEVIRDAVEREPEEPTREFLWSLLRAGAEGSGQAVGVGEAPEVPITRPSLSRTHVGLGCGHVAPAPMAKKMPAKIPCFSCLAGLPTDLEVARGIIDDADNGTLRALLQQIERRLG